MTIEDILEEAGGCGRFQVLVVVCVLLNRVTLGWSMLQMCFTGLATSFTCKTPNSSVSQTGCYVSVGTNDSILRGEDAPCDEYQFPETPLTTVNQWRLVCDMAWVPRAVISGQMAGVLVGELVAGRLQGLVGCKKTMYIFVLEHALLNLVTAFSVNWQMFAACRALVGLGIGAIMVTSISYPMEFLPQAWRPLVSRLPVWSVGVALLSLAAWILQNWWYLHLACGLMSVPGLLGYWYTPENLRWLTLHQHFPQAQDVVARISQLNQRFHPRKASIMLQTVAWEEQKAVENTPQFNLRSICTDRSTVKTTTFMSFIWFTLSLVYYGMCFSVTSLEGNIYLNIFLFALVELPAILFSYMSDFKLGRKWSSILALILATFCSFVGVFVYYYARHEDLWGPAMTTLCLAIKLGAGSAWAVMEAWTPELYPISTRNQGTEVTNVAARIGAIASPFIIDLEHRTVPSCAVMGCLLVIAILLCLLTPETRPHRFLTSSSSRFNKKTDVNMYTIDIGTSSKTGVACATEQSPRSDLESLEQHELVGTDHRQLRTALSTISEVSVSAEETPEQRDQVAQTSIDQNIVVIQGNVQQPLKVKLLEIGLPAQLKPDNIEQPVRANMYPPLQSKLGNMDQTVQIRQDNNEHTNQVTQGSESKFSSRHITFTYDTLQQSKQPNDNNKEQKSDDHRTNAKFTGIRSKSDRLPSVSDQPHRKQKKRKLLPVKSSRNKSVKPATGNGRQERTNAKKKDEYPSYIESQYHKKIRYSIY